MIRLAASILVRALVELGLVLFLFAAVFFVVAFRTARRFATPAPDKLDRMSAELARLLSIGLVASRRASAASDGSDEPELVFELDEIDGLEDDEREQSVDFWRSVVV